MMQEAYWHLFHNGLTYWLAFWTCLDTMLDARPTVTTPLDYVTRDRSKRGSFEVSILSNEFTFRHVLRIWKFE